MKTNETKRLNNIINGYNNPIENPSAEEAEINFYWLKEFTKEATAKNIIPVGYFPNNKWVINKEKQVETVWV